MSQIATNAIQDTIHKTGNTHPAPRKPEPDPCPQCQHCTTDKRLDPLIAKFIKHKKGGAA